MDDVFRQTQNDNFKQESKSPKYLVTLQNFSIHYAI